MTIATRIGALMLATTALSGPALAQTDLTMWYHGAGNEVERSILEGIVNDFNASQSDWKVSIQQFPQAAYNDSVIAAALAGELPDILDVDGPNMPNWAWAGYLAPLDIDPAKVENFLPGPLGKWQGQLYSIGLWDAAIAIYARKSVLDENNIRIPTLDKPWTGDEFNAALETLKASGKFDFPIDLGMSDVGEWYPYAFSPFLQSFGGDLVDRTNYQSAEGVLNGDDAVKFGEWWQSMFKNGYAPGPSQDPADHASGFIDGKYALSWNGNWVAVPAMEKYGDDLLFLPAPDFGHGPKIGAASWQFGVSATSDHKDGASKFIEFAIQDKYLAQFSDGIGLIPATRSAAAMTKNYKEGAPMAVFFDYSEKEGVLRPVTPGYVVESQVFTKAMGDIANGGDPADVLDGAVDEINADIQKNNGYGQQG